ncbi:hypothetical protein LBMAG18_01700 [Alphaproteobacteria bacterium]|nr:hypothetical protein LBMAG18_01700 [Alphaproteobacteria bacterium]
MTLTKNILKLTKIIELKNFKLIMSEMSAEKKFENSRKKLANTLKNLEEIIKDKIQQSAVEDKMLNESFSSKPIANIDQKLTIENQNKEITRLTQMLNDFEKEAEFLREKNKILTQKILHFRNQASNIVDAVQNDIIKIEDILKNHDS